MEAEGDYSYINESEYNTSRPDGMKRGDSHTYVDLKRPSEKTSREPGRPRGAAVQSTASDKNGCCGRLSCWVWMLVIVVIVILASALTGTLVYFLSSPSSSPSSTPPVDPEATSTGVTPTVDSTTTRPTNLPPVNAATTAHTLTQTARSKSPTPSTSGHDSSTPLPSCSNCAKNCLDVYNSGMTTSGVYSIYPNGTTAVSAFCEQELEGGGWTVFQRRINGVTDFYRYWDDYKWGFGDPSSEYWLGNEHLHALTVKKDQMLKIELQHDGEIMYADYAGFSIGNEEDMYRLYVAGYSRADPPGDSLSTPQNGQPFSTRDMDNAFQKKNCAQMYSSAWWYFGCHQTFSADPTFGSSNLNGLLNTNTVKGANWRSWLGGISVSGVRMMIKTRS